MRGKSSKESPGGLSRRGPAHDTGLARSLHWGSVRMFRPLICTNSVAWPIQVMLGFMLPARRIAPSLATRGATNVRGEVVAIHKRRAMKLQRVHVEGRRK